MAPSIDKGQAGSKTVRAGRTAFWQIRCKGEPPPVFTWVHPVHGNLSSCEAFTVMTEEYQGGATTTLVIHHAEEADRGTYTLKAENRFLSMTFSSFDIVAFAEMEARRWTLT